MANPRRLFRTEEAILKAIDRLNEKMARECAVAEFHNEKADRQFAILARSDPDRLNGKEREVYASALGDAKTWRTLAERHRKHQAVRRRRMAQLKTALAEMRTQPFPFLGDASVIYH